MTKRAKRILLTIGGIFVIFVIAIVGLAWQMLNSFDKAFAEPYPHRPDAEMISNFHEHRPEFELIRSMLSEDSEISRIDEDWTNPANLDAKKVNKYRSLFVKVGTPRGVNKRVSAPDFDLIASTLGWVASGSAKGYAYAVKKPTSGYIVDSLDDTEVLSVQARYLRRIDDNWYLYFER